MAFSFFLHGWWWKKGGRYQLERATPLFVLIIPHQRKKSMPVQIKDTTIYSVTELSKTLSLTPVSIRNYIKQGKIRGQKLGHNWVVSYEDLMRFLKTGQTN
jgi:excisionase family DNA binding protein